MRRKRTGVTVAFCLAWLAGVTLVCPCPEPAIASHECCAELGFRAATSCCSAAPASTAPAVADGAPAPFGAPLAAITIGAASPQSASPAVVPVPPHVTPPPAVLRI